MSATPLKDMIRAVNGRVNRRLLEDSDLELYERADFWQHALAQRECVDATLMKLHMLLDQGFPEPDLYMTICMDRRCIFRPVIVAHVEDGFWALDTQHFFIKRVTDLGYRMIKLARFNGPWLECEPGDNAINAGLFSQS